MERSVALKRLSKVLGKKARYRVDQSAPSADEREASRVELSGAVAERNAANERLTARYNEILNADAEYQALKSTAIAARKRVEQISSRAYRKKITVGIDNGLFFHVKAEGDSWEEIFEKLARSESK